MSGLYELQYVLQEPLQFIVVEVPLGSQCVSFTFHYSDNTDAFIGAASCIGNQTCAETWATSIEDESVSRR